jgi:chaperonin GroES
MNLNPLFDRVVLTRKASPEQTASGLFLGKTSDVSNYATVVAAGPGKVNDLGVLLPMNVQEGDTVLLGKWAGDAVQVEGVDMIIVRESDILAVIEE